MQSLIPRLALEAKILTCLDESPVTALLGARQTGKSTLAHLIAKKFDQVTTFDLESAVSRRALQTPELTLSDCEGLVILDEIQRMPELFTVLRPLCDRSTKKAKFLILGSASPRLVRGVSESLAGRVLFVSVSGFILNELGDKEQNKLWLRGSFPRSYLAKSDGGAWRWLEGFVTTFLERDIPQLGIQVPAETLRRFWMMMAHYHGQIWNRAEVGKSMSISPNTVAHYLDILHGTYMLRVLPAWYENLKKRQVKAPKVFFRDSGVFHHLLGIDSIMALRSHPRYGASWEGFAMEQTLSILGERNAYFWNAQGGAELDLLLIRGKRYGFEFKCADAPDVTRSMQVALQDLELEKLYVIYPGKERYRLQEKVEVISLAHLSEKILDEGNGTK